MLLGDVHEGGGALCPGVQQRHVEDMYLIGGNTGSEWLRSVDIFTVHTDIPSPIPHSALLTLRRHRFAHHGLPRRTVILHPETMTKQGAKILEVAP